MAFEVSKVFVLSTSHVPEDKQHELDANGSPTIYGWFISTCAIENMAEDNYFSWVNPILHFVHQEKAQYVMFDSDGPVYSELMCYEW